LALVKYKAGTSNLLQRNENSAGVGFGVPVSFLLAKTKFFENGSRKKFCFGPWKL